MKPSTEGDTGFVRPRIEDDNINYMTHRHVIENQVISVPDKSVLLLFFNLEYM